MYHHGLELAELWTGGLSWRRLGVLIQYLPAESATKTALRDAIPVEELQAVVSDETTKYGPWSQTDMLLAQLIDIASWLRWSKSKAAEDRPTEPPPPFPRPGVTRHGAKPAVDAKVISLLEYVRNNNGASPEGFAMG